MERSFGFIICPLCWAPPPRNTGLSSSSHPSPFCCNTTWRFFIFIPYYFHRCWARARMAIIPQFTDNLGLTASQYDALSLLCCIVQCRLRPKQLMTSHLRWIHQLCKVPYCSRFRGCIKQFDELLFHLLHKANKEPIFNQHNIAACISFSHLKQPQAAVQSILGLYLTRIFACSILNNVL